MMFNRIGFLLEALKQKLTEEVGEFLADDNAEEIADILEVLHAIARYKGDRDV